MENREFRPEEIRFNGDAQEYLLQIPMFTKEKHSIPVIRKVFERIGRIPEGRIIHVAGTNGKGSVCAFLSSVLKEAGYRVGTFTSPHLVSMRERICLNGEMIGKTDFEHCFRQALGDIRACMKDGISHPAFFEFLFYIAMIYFCEEKADYIILETGLGGRLDATNICMPKISVITSIGMDHMEFLGNTIEEIAGEKAGIIKNNVPVVFSASSEAAEQVIRKKAEEHNAPYYPVYPSDYEAELTDGSVLVRTGWKHGEREDQILVTVPFPALYQAENAVTAIRALEVLGDGRIDQDAVLMGIERTKWPGRMEQVLPGVYLDGAHNADGILKFTETVRQIGGTAKLLFSVVADKEYDRMAEILCGGVEWKEITIAHIGNSRGLDTYTIQKVFKKYAACPVKVSGSVKEAFEDSLRDRKEDETLYCAGSLYFVGEVKEALKEYGPD